MMSVNQRYLESQKNCRIIHVGAEKFKLPTTENKVNELADKFLQINEFPHVGQGIHEWTKYNLWKTAFKNFYLDYSCTS